MEDDLLLLHVVHHAVDALLRGDVGAVDQAVGGGVEVLAAVRRKKGG